MDNDFESSEGVVDPAIAKKSKGTEPVMLGKNDPLKPSERITGIPETMTGIRLSKEAIEELKRPDK